MTNPEYTPQQPVTFDVVENHTTVSPRRFHTYIGNTGGEYIWREEADFFDQNFEPDGNITAAKDPQAIIKYTTLYPAVLWHFLMWHDGLENSDARKHITLISGFTNKEMSDIRSNLLGSYYSAAQNNTTETTANDPRFRYRIDLQQLKNDHALMAKLEKFAKRAETRGYTTSRIQPPAGVRTSIVYKNPDAVTE